MWNGNNYGGYMPYSTPYNGYNNNQGNYTGQSPFAPQNNNYAPPAQSQQQPAQMNTNKIYVTGIDDARARQLPPNSDFIFLDNDKPLLYRKTVDATGKMEIHTFKISEYNEEQEKKEDIPVVPQIDTSKFVSVKDFERLRDDIGYDFDAVKDDIERIKNAVNKLNQQLSQSLSKPKSEAHREPEPSI